MFVVATALVAIAAIVPAAAMADAGGDEYTLNVPGGGNTPLNGQSGGGGGSGGTSSGTAPDVSAGTATEATTTPTNESSSATGTGGSGSSAKGSNQHVNNGGGGDNSSQGGGSGEKPRNGLVSPENTSAPTVGADSSDDGGVPVFLIALAILAAACVGVAVWRMRRGGDDTGGDSRSTTEPGTQSL